MSLAPRRWEYWLGRDGAWRLRGRGYRTCGPDLAAATRVEPCDVGGRADRPAIRGRAGGTGADRSGGARDPARDESETRGPGRGGGHAARITGDAARPSDAA